MFLPNFNPKSYSDEQLLNRIAELTGKMNFMSQSSNGGMEVLRNMLEALEFEYRERQYMVQWKLMTPYFSKTIETEPDLVKDKNEIFKKDKPKRKQSNFIRTSKPGLPDKE